MNLSKYGSHVFLKAQKHILAWIRGSDNRENKEELEIKVGTVRYGTVRILGSVLKTSKGLDWIMNFHKFEKKFFLKFGCILVLKKIN